MLRLPWCNRNPTRRFAYDLSDLAARSRPSGRSGRGAESARLHSGPTRGPIFVALTYAYRGDHDRALNGSIALTSRKTCSGDIVGDPLFKSLANDPRYKAFLRKMNLPE